MSPAIAAGICPFADGLHDVKRAYESMIAIAAALATIVLTFLLNWLFRKRLGRYTSYILANVLSFLLVGSASDIAVMIFDVVPAAVSLVLPAAFGMQVNLLFWGIAWLRIYAFKHTVPRPAARRAPKPRPTGRIEPAFGAPARGPNAVGDGEGAPLNFRAEGDGLLQQSIDAIYEDEPEDVGSNFFIHYWRGHYSLLFSFWVVGILVAIVSVAGVLGLEALLASSEGYNPSNTFYAMVSVWVFTLALWIWNIVGLWRSATRSMLRRWRQGRHTVWGAVVKFIIIASVFATASAIVGSELPQMREAFDMAYRGDPRIPDYALRVMRNGTEVEIIGGFKYGLDRAFNQVLDASPQIAVVHLDSGGGRLGEAKKVRDTIRRRGLVTYVSNECMSFCTIAFAGGWDRWLGPSGKLGFHGPTFPGLTAEELADETARLQALYVREGFDPSFVARALAVSPESIWTPTPKELSSANVISHIAPLGKFAMSGLGDVSIATAAPIVTSRLPVVAAIEEKDPPAAQTIYLTFYQLYRYGSTWSEATAKIRAHIAAETRKLLAQTDDQTVLQFGRLMADTYRQLYKMDSAVCYKYTVDWGFDVSMYLTPELMERESALQEKVIRTAAPHPASPSADIDAGARKVRAALQSRPEGKNLALLGRTPRPEQYADYCALHVAMSDAILRLEPKYAAAVIRDLASGGQ